MEILHNIRHNVGRIAIMSILATCMIVGLAACGTSNEPAAQPTATLGVTDPPATDPTAPAMDPPTTDPTAVPTDTPVTSEEMTPADMGAMPTADAAQSAAGGLVAPADTTSGQTDPNATMIDATLREWGLDLSVKEVPAGKIVFTVSNTGMFPHNLTVTDSSGTDLGHTPNFPAAEGPKTLEIELAPGTYTIICSLPGHAARGQKAELVVK